MEKILLHWQDILSSCTDEEPSRRIGLAELRERVSALRVGDK
jgi:hypothetical protein